MAADKTRYLKDLEMLMQEYKTDRQTVVVSTASPFKFCDSVLDALGEKADDSGVKLIEKLASFTGNAAPAPLCGLDKRLVRFETVIEKQAMKQTVTEFLK